MRQLHVAVAQINSVGGNPQANLQRILPQVQSAAAVGVDVILFSETSIHAYDMSPENLALAEPLGGPLTSQIGAWAKQYNIHILAGFLEKNGDQLHNSHVIARPDGTLLVERKHYLTPTELNAGLTPGKRERTVFEINGVRCAVLICADSGIEGIYEEIDQQGVEYRFHPTAGGGFINNQPIPYLHEEELADPEKRKLAEEYRKYVLVADAFTNLDKNTHGAASANAMGYDGKNIRHMGHCIITDRFGTLRAQIPGTLIIEHQQDQMVHALLTF
ncbi:MAG: carbon-nitrogen hydrolase family protein [Armatimonadota bacterium]